ncbi:hypothetical protein HPB48_007090 [Haemaphysalis longicornis]|uniref:Uncharacterized protein n=1 Tax=Haemaphysalis longicornis TaxID=44386 RepID=A0A9J6G3G1_HAELO|nr:hypothetical protein HPB48_007090 [Haemaphysalis longicornis]
MIFNAQHLVNKKLGLLVGATEISIPKPPRKVWKQAQVECLLVLVPSELTRNVEGPIALILVGNKCDLAEQRAVEKADAQRYARGVGGHFFECSALSNEGG